MPKPEVIGRPYKVGVRISWTNSEGGKCSKAFEVYGISPQVAEEAVRETLADLTAPGNPARGEGS